MEDVKLRHIGNYVDEEARQAVQHLRLTTGNYDVAVRLLTDRFGRPDQIIASHLHHLERLPSIDNEDDVAGLQTLHTDVTVHLQGLGDLGEDINQFAGTLGPTLWKKLPEQLKRQWVANEPNKITNLNRIMDMLKKAVESKERFAVLSGNDPKNKKPSPETKLPNPVATAAALAGTMMSACIFCS